MRKLEPLLTAWFGRMTEIADAKAKRSNVDLDDLDQDGSVMALFDGAPVLQDAVPSSGTTEFEHVAEVDLVVVGPDETARNAEFDRLVQALHAKMAEDFTFGGLCDFAEVRAPRDIAEERALGAENVKAGLVPVAFYYVSDSTTG